VHAAAGEELTALAVDANGDLDLSPDGAMLLVREELGGVSFWDVSRDGRDARAIARLIHCLVPLALDDANRLVERAPDPSCP
jgi:hypothetical protein